MATAAPTTMFESVRDEIASLAQELEKKAEKGSAKREFVNGLLRDLHVVQELAKAQPARFDDMKFLEPFVEGFVAKLGIVPGFFADSAPRARQVADKVRSLMGERAALEQAREIARPLFADLTYKGLHADARAEIEAAKLKEAMTGTGPLRGIGFSGGGAPGGGAAPADVLAVSRLAAALALHRAHLLAPGDPVPEALPAKVLHALESWLENRGALAGEAGAGDARGPEAPPGDQR